MEQHYHVLGLTAGASKEAIKDAFRKKALAIHPDVNNEPAAARDFMALKTARDELLKHRRLTTAAEPTSADSTNHAVPSRPRTSTVHSLHDDTMTIKELEHILRLDRLARKYMSRPIYARWREPRDVRKHRRTLHVAQRRIDGRY